MTKIIKLKVSSSKDLVYIIDTVEQLMKDSNIKVINFDSQTRGVEEIILTVISSSALVVVANALRDLATKKRIAIHFTSADGNDIEIKAEGKDIAEAAEIVGYLSNNIKKDTKNETLKNINDNQNEIVFKIVKD